MPEISVPSPLMGVLAAYFLPCVASALAGLLAWHGFRRLGQDVLREAAWALAIVAVIQAALSVGGGVVTWPGLGLLLRGLEYTSAAILGWAFLGRARLTFLVGSLSAGGVLGAFGLSLWQLAGAEPGWAAPVWYLSTGAIYGVAAVYLGFRRHERPLTLSATFTLLMSSAILSAGGWIQEAVILRLVAFPLLLLGLMRFSSGDLESIQAEFVSFSEYSLRQTQQLLTLLRASTALLTRSDVIAILREAAEGVALGVGADSVLIALADETPEHELRVQVVYPPRPLRNPAVIRLSSQPAVADAIRLGRQTTLTRSQRGIHALAALMGSDAGPAIIQPMLCQQHMLGVIVALNGRSHRTFTESEQHVLEAFSAQVAIAAQNALLDRMVEQQTRDLTELLSAREEEASRRAAILESIADGVIVLDQTEQIIVANSAVLAMLDLDSALGRGMDEILGSRFHPDDYALIHSRIESGQPLPPGFKLTWSAKTIALSVAPVRLGDANSNGAVMVLRDITPDAEVDRMKSEFAAVVSHELRSPFAALDSSIQLIEKYGLDQWLPDQREQFAQLAQGLKRTETMINNLVTFAAFLSKQGQLRMALVDVGKLAHEAVRALEPIAWTRGVTVTLQVAGELPPVYGDPDRLIEAIYHLAHNAIRFNRLGGAVSVTCYATPDEVIVNVGDTGVGIAPEKLQQVWKDFVQLSDPLRRGVEGLGLGLPLARQVVRAHGGQVWAQSQVGEGSLFGFGLPIAGNVAART